MQGAQAEEIRVFVRDDDVGALTAPLRDVADLLVELGIPCNYQVVPTLLSDEAAAWLRELRERHPALLRLNQHGYRHQQELNGETVYSEFAGGRPLDAQRADIERGREILVERLGSDFGGQVFTPPCHKYDRNTLRALSGLGYRVLSAGVQLGGGPRLYYALGRSLGRVGLLGKRVSYHGRGIAGSQLVELSTAIDVDEDTDARGRRLEKSQAQLRAEFEAARREGSLIGIMLHHETYAARERLAILRGFLSDLRQDPAVRFTDIEGLAETLS